MMEVAKKKQNSLNQENLVHHGAMTLEFNGHNDSNEMDELTKKKVQGILTEMYVRAKKRGRPRREDERDAA